MTADLAARIAALALLVATRLDEDEAAALAWQSPPWGEDATHWKVVGRREPRYDNGRSETLTAIDVSGRPVNWAEAIQVRWDSNGERAAHIARQDPDRTLRRVKAARELVADILREQHEYVPGDQFYSCSQAAEGQGALNPSPEDLVPGSGCWDEERKGKPCDCGRDSRVLRRLEIIAGEWQDG